jgi:hypothetical protein
MNPLSWGEGVVVLSRSQTRSPDSADQVCGVLGHFDGSGCGEEALCLGGCVPVLALEFVFNPTVQGC